MFMSSIYKGRNFAVYAWAVFIKHYRAADGGRPTELSQRETDARQSIEKYTITLWFPCLDGLIQTRVSTNQSTRYIHVIL